jgi:hypothetical protein
MFSQLKAALTGGFFGGLIVGLLLGPIPAMAQTRAATLTPSNPKFTTLSVTGSGATPVVISGSRAGNYQMQLTNADTTSGTTAEFRVSAGTTASYFGSETGSATPTFSANRGYFLTNSTDHTNSTNGIDYYACATTGSNCLNYPSHRFLTHGTTEATVRAVIDDNSVW